MVIACGLASPALANPAIFARGLQTAINGANNDKAKAEADAKAAEEAKSGYCQVHPEAAQCSGNGGSTNSPGLVCPPGQVSSGGPPQSATCVPTQRQNTDCPAGKVWSGGPPQYAMCIDAPANPDRNGAIGVASVGNGGDEGGNDKADPRAGSGGDKDIPIPTPRPTDDQLVTADQQQKANQCRDDANSTANACQQALQSINQMQSEVASLTRSTGESSLSACRSMQEKAADIGQRMTNYRSQCESKVTACQLSCSGAVSSLSSLKTSAAYVTATAGNSTCSGSRASLSTMNVNVQQAYDAAKRGQQCARDSSTGEPNNNAKNSDEPTTSNGTANTARNGWQVPDFSSLLPSEDPVTTTTTQRPPQDCSNPEFASQNPVCLCRVNPGHPMCGGSVSSQSDLGTAAKDGAAMGLSPVSQTSGLMLGGDDIGTNPRHVPSKTGRYQGQSRNATGGVSADGGRGTPAIAAGRRAQGLPRYDYGSGGSWGTGGRGQGSGTTWNPAEGDSGKGRAYRATTTAAATANRQVDLRRFLPDATGDSRRPANNAAIGLKHTNIFRTVRDRYGRKVDTLNP